MTTDHRLQEQMYRDFEAPPYLLSEQDNGSTRRLILWKGTELLYSVQYWPNGGSSVEDAYTIMFTYCWQRGIIPENYNEFYDKEF